MRLTNVGRLSLLAVLAVVACVRAPAVGWQQIRKTADGGTMLVIDGKDSSSAAWAASKAMEQHCQGAYEVTEIARTETGVVVASSSGSGSAKVFGTGITYACRSPRSNSLNRDFLAMATRSRMGQQCGSDQDCALLPCRPNPRTPGTNVCTNPDGTISTVKAGETCKADIDCELGLYCAKKPTPRYSGNTCQPQ